MYRKLLLTIVLLAIFSGIHAQKPIRVIGGRRADVDTLDARIMDSIRNIRDLEKLRVDSIRKASIDSTRKVWGAAGRKVSAAERRRALELLNEQIDKNRKFNFTRDTISPGAAFALSLVPGVGQIYNRQYWKLPIFYGGIGGFLAGAIITSQQHTNYRNQLTHALNMNQPSQVTDPLRRNIQNTGTLRTVFYALAGATYLYQLADATFNYRGFSNPVHKATVLAAVFPGAGLIYTKTYWRLPIYYGGFIALATVIDYNNRNYQRYKNAYDALTDGDPTTNDEFRGRYSPDALKNARDGYRRDRDLWIIGLSVAYILSIVDTYVTASLKNWEVSRKLSMHVEPTFFEQPNHGQHSYQAHTAPSGAGLSLKLNF